MPSVPRYDAQVQPSPLPGVRVSTDAPIEAFGGGAPLQEASAAARGAGTAINKFIEEQKATADDFQVKDATSRTIRMKNKLLWDTKTGAYSKKGQNAFGVIDDYLPEFNKQADEIEKSLGNEEQKNFYREIRSKYLTDFDADLQKHLFGETKAVENTITETGVSTAQDDAVANYQDPKRISENINLQKSLLLDYAQKNGLPATWVKEKTEAAVSKTYSEIIKRMLANDQDLKASDYYKTIPGQIIGNDAITIENALQEGSIRGESQRLTAAIASKSLTLTQSIEEARSIKNPAVQDATIDRLRDFYTIKRQAENEAQESMFQDAYNFSDQTGRRPAPDKWIALKDDQKRAIMSLLEHKIKGIEPATNWEVYYALKNIAANPESRNQFKKANLLISRSSLGDTEFKELVSLQTALRGGEDKSDELNGYLTDHQLIDNSLGQVGIDTSDKDNKKRVSEFRNDVNRAFLNQKLATGKKDLALPEKEKIIDNLLIEGVVRKKFRPDPRKRAFELTEGDTFIINVKDIPKRDYLEIQDVLRARNTPITDTEILSLYNLKLQRVRNVSQ
jgi:hypothetical protein